MIQHQEQLTFPYKTLYDEEWDQEWAEDWAKIRVLFNTIDHLEDILNDFEVSILRELTQKKIILDLQKYAYSLSKIIKNKYSD